MSKEEWCHDCGSPLHLCICLAALGVEGWDISRLDEMFVGTFTLRGRSEKWSTVSFTTYGAVMDRIAQIALTEMPPKSRKRQTVLS
jgi:hypothetical protein